MATPLGILKVGEASVSRHTFCQQWKRRKHPNSTILVRQNQFFHIFRHHTIYISNTHDAIVLTVAAGQEVGIQVHIDTFHGNPLCRIVAKVQHLVVDPVDDGNGNLLQSWKIEICRFFPREKFTRTHLWINLPDLDRSRP